MLRSIVQIYTYILRKLVLILVCEMLDSLIRLPAITAGEMSLPENFSISLRRTLQCTVISFLQSSLSSYFFLPLASFTYLTFPFYFFFLHQLVPFYPISYSTPSFTSFYPNPSYSFIVRQRIILNYLTRAFHKINLLIYYYFILFFFK